MQEGQKSGNNAKVGPVFGAQPGLGLQDYKAWVRLRELQCLG